MVTLYNEGNKKLVAGIVCEDAKEINKDGVKKAIIKLKDRNGEELSVFFSNKEGGPQLADRVMKVAPSKGTPLTVLCYVDDGKDVGTGLDFRFKKSVWTFQTDKGDINVLFGTICGQREISDTAVGCSVPVSVYNPDTKSRDEFFASVAFYDGDTDEKKFAQKAKKLLFHKNAEGGYDNRPGAIVCGSCKEKEQNGRVYKNYSGWRVEVLDYEI